ncbi:MAG: sigma-70 family RNA polymerase sigma factor [Planctomycetes bacterium]|nr:sigma-70 family RNA polymerase sigma factor [Planctomycetota bacterium]
MTDEELSRLATSDLIGRARRADEQAWRELLRRFGPTLSLAVHGRIPTSLRGRFDTDDVVQSAFLDVFSSLDAFEYADDESFRGWLRRIAQSKLIDRIRQHTRARRAPASEHSDQPAEAHASPGERTPSEIVGEAEHHALLLDALTRLEPIDRDLVWMRLFEERAWAEIAEVLHLTASVAQKRYARVLRQITRGLS